MEEAGWRNAPQPHDRDTKQDIDRMRQAIDSLDQTIASLLAQRLLLTCEIGAVKAGSALPVKDASREQKVLANVRAVTDDPRIACALANIYQTVMNESCVLQRAVKNVRNTADSDGGSPAETTVDETVLYFPRVLIIGTGLIGSALAAQIKRRLPQTIVSAVDTPAVLDQARAANIIDSAETDLAKAVSRAGLILLCASPEANLCLLAEIAPHTKHRQVVMDVTSTKEQICRQAELLSLKADFVGGHPLFGSQETGVSAGEKLRVDGQKFCLVATTKSSELTMRRLARWLNELGMRVITSGAAEHDAALARTSHAVQLLAIALGRSIAAGRSNEQLCATLSLSGTALSEWSRLMTSPVKMWLHVIRQNKKNIVNALNDLIDQLENTKASIETGDEQAIKRAFADAARVPAVIESINDHA